MDIPLPVSLLLLVALSLASELDFTVEVPAGKFQCYFQAADTARHRTMEVDYQVIDGGDLNVNFMLLLGANIIVQDKMKTDGSHRINIDQTGDYQVCFDNTFSYQTRKVVFFEIFLFDANGNIDEPSVAGLAKPDDQLQEKMRQVGMTITDFHTGANRVKASLNKIEYYQALMRAQEARDRAIMNANFDRVTFWSLVHTLAMLSVGAVQVYMIRCLFEDNSKIGRLLRKGTRAD
ncbi:hypothetical protein WR25_05914 [Diploscapter pachys]|uniref:GOLD domain-containing protein n=1 Tax=Diploscapter pachys TaxID=2018661 RepID=A0A2A2KVA9_9BILA|nr:hypothetical protein WR25_05914 [Diploscapter pachys]